MKTIATTYIPLDEAYAECERLAGRDKPHLYAAAHLFERPEVRRAFVATYASMRLIDDAVDDIPHRSALTREQQARELSRVQSWLNLVDLARQGNGQSGPTWTALSDTFSRFEFPLDPWANLAGAMSSDLVTSSFRSWNDLRRYMQGASVAPAVVFMYLVLMRPDASGCFRTMWTYEQVHAATEDLAIFCYCVHILRDVAIDLSLGESGLVYLPTEELSQFGMTASDLYDMRKTGRATGEYRALAEFAAARAREHLQRGRRAMNRVLREAEPSNGRALQILIDTYERILKDLQDRDFDVFAKIAPH